MITLLWELPWNLKEKVTMLPYCVEEHLEINPDSFLVLFWNFQSAALWTLKQVGTSLLPKLSEWTNQMTWKKEMSFSFSHKWTSKPECFLKVSSSTSHWFPHRTLQSAAEHFDFLSRIYNLTNLLNTDHILHVSGAGSSYNVKPNCLVTVDR